MAFSQLALSPGLTSSSNKRASPQHLNRAHQLRMLRFAAVAGGSGALSVLLLSHFRVHASSKKEDGHGATKLWDFNWDRMANRMEHSKATDARGPENDSPSAAKPSATRTLVLIRHGQYEHLQDDSDKKILTKLGREQAQLTGERLRELGEKYTMMHYSSMPRATETADIISKYLPDVPMRKSDMLREGAPIHPEPPHSTWKPEEYVRMLLDIAFQYMLITFHNY